MDTRFADTAFGRIEYLDRGQGHPVACHRATEVGAAQAAPLS